MSPEQCKSARGLLGWSKERLALESGSQVRTIRYFEAGDAALQARTRTRIMQTLVGSGVEFIAESGGGAGVRLRKSPGPSQSSEGQAGIIDQNEI